MTQKLNLLILGGYGTFGGRLAQLLCDEDRVCLIIAGRSLAKAEQFCHSLHGRADRVALQFDRDGDIAEQLQQTEAGILVDCSGPFQSYGDDPYRVVKACLANHVHYMDLADGSDFVRGIAAFERQARDAGLFALSGASSYPVLTAAVIRELMPGMAVIRVVRGGIAPSPYAGVGRNVIRAIASYCGQGVPIRRHAATETAYPFTEKTRYVIAPPGKLPLKPTIFSLVDVPDLQVIPAHWPELEEVWMGAGPVPYVLHKALRALAWMVRWGWLKTLSPLSGLMYQAVNTLSWGEHRGGMFIELTGQDAAGQTITRSWHLLAEGDDGPLIPSMAAAAIISRCLDSAQPAPGARPAINDLELSDYQTLFNQRTITTGIRSPDRLATTTTLYKQILGNAWDSLPAPIQAMHAIQGGLHATGMARVTRGDNGIARFIAWLFRFPPAGKEVPVTVTFTVKNGRQHWQRKFAEHRFSSVQFAGSGACDRLLCERFGLLTFGLALVVDDARLYLVIRRWHLLGLPLPLFLAPRNHSYESVELGKFNFNVDISLPLIGRIVNYRGWLVPENPS